jgi:hypothetical protein
MADRIINWERFKLTNNDERGVQLRFEDLCRQLFIREYLSGNKIVKYVYSIPNNPGIEAEPVLDEINNKWLGYQAKFFDSRTNYNQILDSAQKTVENYAGKVDIVFLYCNKSLSIKAKDYQKAEKLLYENKIKLIPVPSDAIFDQVRKYPDLAMFYFGQHPINHVWLMKHNHRMLVHMGERFNADFNVDTHNDWALSCFLHTEIAVNYLNERKQSCLSRINSYQHKGCEFKEYLTILNKEVLDLPDIAAENIKDSFYWFDKVYFSVKKYYKKIENEKDRTKKKSDKLYKVYRSNEISGKRKEAAKQKYFEAKYRWETLNDLLSIILPLSISDYEKKLITGKALSVTGKAGVGKSQLLANAISLLIESGQNALLLLGHLFCTDQPMPIQIIEKCNLNFSFNELIDILEVLGERDNRVVPLFIDAINETWNYSLWKDALPIIIDKVESCTYVKLVFSYRPEYEKYLLSTELVKKIKESNICHIIHNGFADNSLAARKRFFNHYGIPFTPNEYFNYELDNPLFLKLYCKAYKEGDVSLPLLYERILASVNEKFHIIFQKRLQDLRYLETEDLITPFIIELADNLIVKADKRILKDELIQFKCWQQVGIPAHSFIPHVVRENLLYTFVDEKGEHYFFAYDQMNDYYCAKALVRRCSSKAELRNKLVEEFLCINNGMIGKLDNVDLFVNTCAIYADCSKEKGEFCIDILDKVTDENDREELLDRLVLSFMWRNKDTVSGQFFLDLCRKYSAEVGTFWKVLISNSVKINHPLNADFLHSLLLSYDLNKRDYVWTTYINDTFSTEDNIIVQMIHGYVKGEKIVMHNAEQTRLLLTLFGWFLTSSSRELRDYTSKAMIEILKDNFALCEVLLRKFESVNDPYVIQRLYGIVFGACCKRQGNQLDIYKTLAEYVYETVFNQESVYPDILLRDYARLIIERFLWEQPVYDGVINKLKIKPPYNSEPIPVVEEDYLKLDCTGGIRCIKSSMHFVDKGFYGDFGRYVFQSALSNFEVDHNCIFNYAMHFIILVLGYKEEMFGDNDLRLDKYNFNRDNTIKIERIGKKYQWIALYNILARVADHYKMKRRYDDEPDEIQYEGPWTLYLRDFDPTLNQSFMKCKDVPVLSMIDKFLAEAREENNQKLLTLKGHEEEWLGEEGSFFRNLKNALLLEDDSGKQWLALTNYCGTNGKNLLNEGLAVWSWLYAFFVTPEQERMLLQLNAEGNDLRCFDYRSNTIYTLFNREFPWADGSELYKKQAWVEPVINNVRASLNQLFIKNIGKIMHASYDWAWDAEYDATKSETVIWSLPCAELIETLKLKQQEYDSFYYDNNGQLAAFDVRRVQDNGRAVIRKDLLDKFLAERKLRLIWIVNAEKEIHNPVTRLVSQYSEWTGVLSYNGSDINGRLWRIKK